MRSTCCRLVGLELYVDIHFVTFQTAYRFSVAVCEIVFRCHPTLMPPDVSAEMDMQLLMWLFSYAQASHAQPYRPPLVGVFDSRSVSTPVNTSCARRTGSSQQSPCVKSPCACCSTLHLQSCCSHDRAEGRHWENFSTVTGHELFCTLQEKTHGASRRGCTWHENLSYGRPLRRWHGLKARAARHSALQQLCRRAARVQACLGAPRWRQQDCHGGWKRPARLAACGLPGRNA